MDSVKKAEEMDVIDAKQVKGRATSASYTIKACAENIRRLNEIRLIDDTELKEWQKLHKKVLEKFIQNEFGI